MELCSRLDAAGKRPRNNLDLTETRKLIKTLEDQHVVKAGALQEMMERLEAAKREWAALQTNLDARCAAAEEHATGLLEGKRTLQVALKDVFKEINERRLLLSLPCGVARNNARQMTITTTVCVHCWTATHRAPCSIQARPQNITTTMKAVGPTNMVLWCSTQT